MFNPLKMAGDIKEGAWKKC